MVNEASPLRMKTKSLCVIILLIFIAYRLVLPENGRMTQVLLISIFTRIIFVLSLNKRAISDEISGQGVFLNSKIICLQVEWV